MKGNIFISDFHSVSAKLRKLWFLIQSIRSLYSASLLSSNRLRKHVERCVPLQPNNERVLHLLPQLCVTCHSGFRVISRVKRVNARVRRFNILRYPKLTNEKGRDTFARILPHTLFKSIHFLWIRSKYQSTHFFTHKSSSFFRGWKKNIYEKKKGRKIYINDDDMEHSNDGFEGNFLLLNTNNKKH